MNRKTLIAAGLLCLCTSPAFAFTIPEMAPDMAKAVKSIWTDQMAAEKASAFDAGEAWMGQADMSAAKSAGAKTFDKGLGIAPAEATTKMAAFGDPNLD